MSIRRATTSVIAPRTLTNARAAATGWVRNPSWLTLTPVTTTEQRFRGLIAVFPLGSYIALNAQGNYTVDWGDGTTASLTSGNQANKLYNFNDLGADTNAPVTLTDAGDLVERAAHGYSNGMEVSLYNIVSTTGITEGATYYVINATFNKFQISTSAGGSAVALTTDGSATLLPYKQAIVNVTPQAGANLTVLNLQVRNATTGLNVYENGWLDIEISGPRLTTAGLTIGTDSPTVRFAMCERAIIRNSGAVTSFANLFREFRRLREVNVPSLTSINVTSDISADTLTLNDHGLIDTTPIAFSSLGTTTGVSTFTVYFVISSTTNTFQIATSVGGSAINLTGSNSTMTAYYGGMNRSMTNMFNLCRSLETIPLFNTSVVNDMSSAFVSCSSLATIPLLDTGRVTSTNSMFSQANGLLFIPRINTASVTTMQNMFLSCEALQIVPALDCTSVTTTNGMLNGCRSLVSLELLNTGAVTDVNAMLQNCSALTRVPSFSTTAVTSSSNFTNMFNGCNSLSRIEAKDFRFTFSVAACKLGATELNEIYTNLPKLNPDVITVSGSGSVVTYTVNDITAFAVGRTVTITGVTPAAYNLTNVAIATVNVGTSQFTVNNAATGTYVSGGVAAIQSDRTITVSNNVGTATDDPTIAQNKGWTVTG